MEEAFLIGRHGKVPVQISHHKCAGTKNWGRTVETLALIDKYREKQDIMNIIMCSKQLLPISKLFALKNS